MNNRLEQYIREHRDAFDKDMPDSLRFDKLEAALAPGKPATKTFHMRHWAWMAAASLLLIAGWRYWGGEEKITDNGITANSSHSAPYETAEEIDSVYIRQLDQFTGLIKVKRNELEKARGQHPELYRQFVRELRRLDSVNQSLRTELAEYPNQELYLATMIENLQLQLNLLNYQLKIVQQLKTKNYETKRI